MKKETIIAIILGLGLGAVVAFFLIFKTEQKKIENTKTIANNIKTTPAELQNKSNQSFQPLEIIEPETMTIVNEDTVNIKGKAVKDSLIVIQSQAKELTLQNDKEEFNISFPLVLGENVITITSYNTKMQIDTQIKELKVYYLTE